MNFPKPGEIYYQIAFGHYSVELVIYIPNIDACIVYSRTYNYFYNAIRNKGAPITLLTDIFVEEVI